MREYVVMINGLPHTMQLDEETAKRYNAEPVKPKPVAKSRVPQNKQASKPDNK